MEADKLYRRSLNCPAFESLSKQSYSNFSNKDIYKANLKRQIYENLQRNQEASKRLKQEKEDEAKFLDTCRVNVLRKKEIQK